MLVLTDSNGLYSAVGTIFKAAACIIKSTPSAALLNLSLSHISPKKNLNLLSLNFFDICHCFISSLE